MDNPRIWIGDLAAYNAGELVGQWIELDSTTTEGDIEDAIAEILELGTAKLKAQGEWSGPHEEWLIADTDCFGPIKIGEYEQISEILAHVERMGDDPDKYFAYVEHHGSMYADGYTQDSVIGPLGETMLEVAYALVDDYGYLEGVPEHVARYFDYEAFARDLRIEGNFTEYDGQFYEITGD
ncbi:anti-restriction protein [Gordonia phage Daredevil]|uniref:ArdA-like antirestriction protein n=1 Tax=Gordonia phage Daredevil TaxID=2283286 RepID=A0A345MJ13_9CAUD|nr:anti-restriction protein [Gordonia phage Daredevil]AXH70544.1 ArdA-like antirestriction protein [Gordonia phage Daredevil]